MFFIILLIFGECRIFFPGVGPYNPLSEIDSFHNTAVKVEYIKIDPAGTSPNDHGIYLTIIHIFLDEGNAFLAAQKWVGRTVDALFIGNVNKVFHVKDIANAAASADIYSKFLIHGYPLPPHQRLNGL